MATDNSRRAKISYISMIDCVFTVGDTTQIWVPGLRWWDLEDACATVLEGHRTAQVIASADPVGRIPGGRDLALRSVEAAFARSTIVCSSLRAAGGPLSITSIP
jgi:hypothetical protein